MHKLKAKVIPPLVVVIDVGSDYSVTALEFYV